MKKVDTSKVYFTPTDKEKNYAYARSLRAKDKNNKKRNILIIVVSLVVLATIPGIAYLVFRFRFDSTFSGPSLSDYSESRRSSIDQDPIQRNVDSQEIGTFNGYKATFHYVAYYDISAVVTSVHDDFGFDLFSAVSPRDICLAWGDLKDSLTNPDISYHQDTRHCYISNEDYFREHPEEYGFGRKKFTALQYSNNHLIPSTRAIRDQIFGLGRGDKVRIVGYLTHVYPVSGKSITTSTSRTDTGDGACEVIYVTKIEKL